MNLTHRNVTDNRPRSGFYCYLKMVIKYLGMRPGRCLGLGGLGFSVGERAPGGSTELASWGACAHCGHWASIIWPVCSVLPPPALVLPGAGTWRGCHWDPHLSAGGHQEAVWPGSQWALAWSEGAVEGWDEKPAVLRAAYQAGSKD